jgi:hypothetical protein
MMQPPHDICCRVINSGAKNTYHNILIYKFDNWQNISPAAFLSAKYSPISSSLSVTIPSSIAVTAGISTAGTFQPDHATCCHVHLFFCQLGAFKRFDRFKLFHNHKNLNMGPTLLEAFRYPPFPLFVIRCPLV